MLKHWWKILGALLVLYTLIAGFMIPLKPGIQEVTPTNAQAGDNLSLAITGYNSHFKDAKEIKAWLKYDSTHYIVGENIRDSTQTLLFVDFKIPTPLPIQNESRRMTLILTNEVDGYSLLPDAVEVVPMGIDTIMGQWGNTIGGLHEVKGTTFPYRNILYETIRNLFFHVPLWFAMIILFFFSTIYGIIYLILGNSRNDHMVLSLNQVGILYGILGLVTGAIWANWTWGEPWSGDVKQNMSAVAILVYLAYLVLRNAFDDYEQQARYSAVYNIFAFVALIPLLFVLPRLYDSLHPGNGGNPGFGGEDLDNTMRMVFYPAIIGWTLLGAWMAQLARRYMALKHAALEKDVDF